MGDMREELLTIGRFARLCRLSVKQLRHYDETGLLRPVRVDPGTGYRYYAAAQARDALTIALLRDLDVPLPAIAEVLAADGPARARVLRQERDRLAARIARDTERLRLLDRLAGTDEPGYEVSVAREPARRLAVVSAACAAEEVGAAIGRCVGELLAAVAGRAWTPPVWGLFPIDLADGMRVAAGVEIGQAPPGTRAETLAAGPAAVTVHAGPYAELPLAYHALLAWIHERGLRPRGPVREAYLVGPGEAGPAELLTKVVVPLDPGDPGDLDGLDGLDDLDEEETP